MKDDRRIQSGQHPQKVVAPNIFFPGMVRDGRAVAYSPGRPLPLGGGTGETVSVVSFFSFNNITYIYHHSFQSRGLRNQRGHGSLRTAACPPRVSISLSTNYVY